MMEFSMRSFAVVSLLLLVSLSTDMSGPLVVDARACNWDLCEQYCSSQGLPACCPGPSGPCRCTAVCPRNRIMSGPLARVRRCDVDLCNQYCSLQNSPGCCSAFNDRCVCGEICPNKEPFIKEIVIA
ncbi:Hypothetical predicted protein [Olea europaea subsp. europaea]|uniref:Uncharacterized protein n=1 Tax=Olea europaea subsp. europaea TaxID=158383 RepID=A0A8S0P996_OLEEU|nr:Hypothetical predicted protein [Olea europaea subsp. europaea]CAA2971618.1 Hypothetical predicted protein [Olea europaea subsp. europaea]